MKKLIFLLFALFFFACYANAQYPEIAFMDNEGIERTGMYNYTMDCIRANSNTLTILLDGEGQLDLVVSYNENGTWVGEGFKVLDYDLPKQVYIYRFYKDGLYKLRAISTINNSTYITTVYLNVIAGNGTYTNQSELIKYGRWVQEKIKKYGTTFDKFIDRVAFWVEFAYNPLIILSPLAPLPYYILIPYVWMWCGIFLGIYIWHKKRIFKLAVETKKYLKKGKDTITKKLLELYDTKLSQKILNRRLDDDLQEGNVSERVNAYAMGVDNEEVKWNAQNTSTLVKLASWYFNNNQKLKEKAEKIINALEKEHPLILPKYQIFFDMGVACKALSGALEVGQPNTKLYQLAIKCFEESEKLAPTQFIEEVIQPARKEIESKSIFEMWEEKK